MTAEVEGLGLGCTRVYSKEVENMASAMLGGGTLKDFLCLS